VAFFDGAFGTLYSFYMERERLARVIGRVVWAGDLRPLYESFDAIAEVPDGGLVVDAPCGSGIALRGLPPGKDVRYLAIDISRRMLARTAARRREQVECIQADATALPVPDQSADLFLSHFGLHCFADPHAAIEEIARVLRPGGRLVASAIVPGGRRGRLIVQPNRGGFGPVAGAEQLQAWMAAAGLEVTMDRRNTFAYFSGRS
jgi:ubiquinone/menaquinone biosynthesis C-methylase UbiE